MFTHYQTEFASFLETEETDTVCRLCLKICRNGQALEGFTSYKLKFVVPLLDLDLSSNPKICKKCSANVNTHYEFKSTCVENNEPMHNFIELELLTRIHTARGMSIRNEEKLKKCGLCHTMKDATEQLGPSGDSLVNTMLDRCFPDLGITKISVPCGKCMDSLENLFAFFNSCMDTEEKIKNYCCLKDLNGQNKVDLHDVLRFSAVKIVIEDDRETDVNYEDEDMEEEEEAEFEVFCPTFIKSEPTDFEEEVDVVNFEEPGTDIDIEEGPDR